MCYWRPKRDAGEKWRPWGVGGGGGGAAKNWQSLDVKGRRGTYWAVGARKWQSVPETAGLKALPKAGCTLDPCCCCACCEMVPIAARSCPSTARLLGAGGCSGYMGGGPWETVDCRVGNWEGWNMLVLLVGVQLPKSSPMSPGLRPVEN